MMGDNGDRLAMVGPPNNVVSRTALFQNEIGLFLSLTKMRITKLGGTNLGGYDGTQIMKEISIKIWNRYFQMVSNSAYSRCQKNIP